MVSRAFHFAAALVAAGFAFTAAPASAGGPCGYSGCATPVYQPTCGSCSATYVQPTTTTVYVPQTVYTSRTVYTPTTVYTARTVYTYAPQPTVAPVEDDYVPTYRPVRRYVRHAHRHPRPYYPLRRYY